MSVPTKKRSKQQKRQRSSHSALKKKHFTTCPKCKKPIVPHQVCPYCGYYKGQDILMLDIKSERKKKKAKKKEDKAKNN